MKTAGLIITCLICTPAQAEPDEATKRDALLWAYTANGNSMTSWSAWDYTTRQQLTFVPRDVPIQPQTIIPKTTPRK